jgi:hypothetical protein
MQVISKTKKKETIQHQQPVSRKRHIVTKPCISFEDILEFFSQCSIQKKLRTHIRYSPEQRQVHVTTLFYAAFGGVMKP